MWQFIFKWHCFELLNSLAEWGWIIWASLDCSAKCVCLVIYFTLPSNVPALTHHKTLETITVLSRRAGILNVTCVVGAFQFCSSAPLKCFITCQCPFNSEVHNIQTLLCNFTLSNVNVIHSTGVEITAAQSVVTLPFSNLGFSLEQKMWLVDFPWVGSAVPCSVLYRFATYKVLKKPEDRMHLYHVLSWGLSPLKSCPTVIGFIYQNDDPSNDVLYLRQHVLIRPNLSSQLSMFYKMNLQMVVVIIWHREFVTIFSLSRSSLLMCQVLNLLLFYELDNISIWKSVCLHENVFLECSCGFEVKAVLVFTYGPLSSLYSLYHLSPNENIKYPFQPKSHISL